MYEKLFSPGAIGTLTIPNRIVMTAASASPVPAGRDHDGGHAGILRGPGQGGGGAHHHRDGLRG